MKIEEYKVYEEVLQGKPVTVLVAKIVFDSVGVSRKFEDANLHGDEEFVKLSLNNSFKNYDTPSSTLAIARLKKGKSVFSNYQIYIDLENKELSVSEEDMLRDSALMTVLPRVSNWFANLITQAEKAFAEYQESLSQSVSESLSLSESVVQSELTRASEIISEQKARSESVWVSESLSESIEQSLLQSESLSLKAKNKLNSMQAENSESELASTSEGTSEGICDASYIALSEKIESFCSAPREGLIDRHYSIDQNAIAWMNKRIERANLKLSGRSY